MSINSFRSLMLAFLPFNGGKSLNIELAFWFMVGKPSRKGSALFIVLTFFRSPPTIISSKYIVFPKLLPALTGFLLCTLFSILSSKLFILFCLDTSSFWFTCMFFSITTESSNLIKDSDLFNGLIWLDVTDVLSVSCATSFVAVHVPCGFAVLLSKFILLFLLPSIPSVSIVFSLREDWCLSDVSVTMSVLIGGSLHFLSVIVTFIGTFGLCSEMLSNFSEESLSFDDTDSLWIILGTDTSNVAFAKFVVASFVSSCLLLVLFCGKDS